LVGEHEQLSCTGCRLQLPQVGRLPWLFADPAAKLAEWRGLARIGLDDMRRDEERLKAELRLPGLLAATMRRLRAELQARVEHRKAVEGLLEPLLLEPVEDKVDVLRVLMGKAAATQSLASYDHNALRDWAWPDSEENARQLELVTSVLGTAATSVRTLLVPGAGACRLAFDLHAALPVERTVAADINPYLLLIGARMAAGKSLALREFPMAPRAAGGEAVARRLEAPGGRAREGLHLVFADILAAPFAEEAFDCVVAPWLVDILPEDAPDVLARLNRLVKPGGMLVYTGSTVFKRGYGRDELLELVALRGFVVESRREDRIPYLCSPSSCQERYETVLSFAARKVASVEAPAPYRLLPASLVDLSRPVAMTEGMARMRAMHAYYAEVLGLVDGRRSVSAIAAELASRHRLDSRILERAVAEFLAGAHELAPS
jgi:SAM-dependent methyltransferase